jgi:nucleoside-diphosphate-sugar epimerase
MNGANRNAVLIGHSGFLGTALRTAITTQSKSNVALVGGEFVRKVLEGNGREAVLPLLAPDVMQSWICAVGVVNPQKDPGLIESINVEFPRRLHSLLGSLAPADAVRLITFGSVLEHYGELAWSNPYLASKSRMFEALQGAGGKLRWHHIRMHTLYGGSKKPHAFLFAGQMFNALVRMERFRMSGGMQLREYHHAQDIAESILSFLGDLHQDPVIDLSSGEPIRLRDLASAVFKYFDGSNLLEIGARIDPKGEVFESMYQRSPYLIASRDPVDGMICWFKELFASRS